MLFSFERPRVSASIRTLSDRTYPVGKGGEWNKVCSSQEGSVSFLLMLAGREKHGFFRAYAG